MQQLNNNQLIGVMTKVAAQRLSTQEIVHALLATDINIKLEKELVKAVRDVVDLYVNKDYRRFVVKEVYGMAEMIAEAEDRPSNIAEYVRENIDVSDIVLFEQRVSYKIAARVLSVFYPRRRFFLYFKRMHISQRLEEVLAAERDRFLDRVVRAAFA